MVIFLDKVRGVLAVHDMIVIAPPRIGFLIFLAHGFRFVVEMRERIAYNPSPFGG